MSLKRKLDEKISGAPSPKKRNMPEDSKISQLLSAVLSHSVLGNLVVILHDDSEHPYSTLQNSLSYLNAILAVTRTDSDKNEFDLKIDGVEYAKGTFKNMQLAKQALAETTLDKLKDTCFFVEKKRDFVNVTKENLQASSSSASVRQRAVGNDSIAHKIMMKMGWTGGGLGAQEQGNLDSVMVYENVNRQGFGSNNLMKEITKKLDEFSKSADLLSLVFNSDFTKEERALIHRVARKLNLKSRSSGSETRKLTVSKKISRLDIVRELLSMGGEDGLYRLHIPRKFVHLWN